jgi:hypothetical protein
MAEYKCPHCDILIERKESCRNPIVCPKCLEAYGKRYIMVESSPNGSYENLGGGFFQKKDDN